MFSDWGPQLSDKIRHHLLFWLTSALMLLAALHLLETFCGAAGLKDILVPHSTESTQDPERFWVTPYGLTIRLVWGLGFVTALYGTLGLRNWGRKLLILFLIVDLLGLVVFVGWFVFTQASPLPGFVLALRVAATLGELLLLSLLLQPATEKCFANPKKKAKLSP